MRVSSHYVCRKPQICIHLFVLARFPNNCKSRATQTQTVQDHSPARQPPIIIHSVVVRGLHMLLEMKTLHLQRRLFSTKERLVELRWPKPPTPPGEPHNSHHSGDYCKHPKNNLVSAWPLLKQGTPR